MGNLVAQTDSPVTPDSASIAAENAAQESLEIFTRNEIRLMDSLLNVWYVKRDLASQNSVLSKLTDDTTKYDHNDSLMYKRLSAIETRTLLRATATQLLRNFGSGTVLLPVDEGHFRQVRPA